MSRHFNTYSKTNRWKYTTMMLNVCVRVCTPRKGESVASLEWATKYNPMYESDVTMGYTHHYRRYPEPLIHSSASAEASTDFSSEEIQHIYENSELTKEVRSLPTQGGC